MNKIKTAISALLLVMSIGAFAQPNVYEGQMRIDPVALQQKGDSLYVELIFDISGVNVDTKKAISLIPSIITSGRRLTLSAVEVKGRNNYRVYERELSLMSAQERKRYQQTAPYAVVRGYNTGESKQILYRKVIPYQEWMSEARLDMQEDLCACGGAPRTLAMSQLINKVSLERTIILEPYTVTPYLAYVKPEIEEVKRRELSAEASLDFAVNQTDIRPDYMNNPRELKKITDLIAEVKGDPAVSVNQIDVIGFASPEGVLEGNKILSEGRANALVGYLTKEADYPRSIYKVVFGGENWAGLAQVVEGSDMQYKDDVLAIIASGKGSSEMKTQIFAIKDGDIYRYMLNNYYPALRVAKCKIDYVVKGFEVADAKRLIKTNAHNLSLNEMFLVANTYEKGSADFIDVFETAVRLFPEDPIANLNAAAAALSRGDVVYAQRYLDKVIIRSRVPEYDNAMGVLLMLKGDYGKAESHLKSAEDAGLTDAAKNLEELARKRENMQQIKEQRKSL